MSVWLVIGIFIIIAIIVALLLWLFWPQISGQSSTTPTTTAVGFLQSCGGNVQCQNNLTCVAGICLKNPGQTCNVSTDCVPPALCLGSTPTSSGVCSIATPGGLNCPSPCNQGLQANNQGICKLSSGSSGCAKNGQDVNSNCITNLCINNVCQEFRQLGQSCQTNQCASGLTCSLGFCQTIGTITGQSGAFCSSTGQPGCDTGLFCNENNVCQSGQQGFMAACDNSTSFCQVGLVCLQDECQFANPPGDCSVSQGCSNGYICSSTTQQCLGQPGAICATNSQCSSGNCSTNQLALYTWNNTNLIWQALANLPANVQFSRIVATTSGPTDTIWGLEFSETVGSGGLYQLTNPTTSTWALGISGTTQTISTEQNGQVTVTTTITIISLATDRERIFVLVKITTTRTPSNNLFFLSPQASSVVTWAIMGVNVMSDNSVSLINLPSLNPPLNSDGSSIVNIIDFDVNPEDDIVIVGNLNLTEGTESNQLYSMKNGQDVFVQVALTPFIVDVTDNQMTVTEQVIVEPPNSIILPRFYFIQTIDVDGLNQASVDNSLNIAYVNNDDSTAQQILFTGPAEGAVLPRHAVRRDFQISDYSIAETTDLLITQIWISAIGVTDPVTDTSYLQVIGGPEYQMPGYNDLSTRLYISPNAVYTQASGVCQ